MTAGNRQQYMERVRQLAAQKMRLAFLRTADSAPAESGVRAENGLRQGDQHDLCRRSRTSG